MLEVWKKRERREIVRRVEDREREREKIVRGEEKREKLLDV